MPSRFDQEFYKSGWQRVLPVGPDGIEPYVQTSRTSRLPARPPELRPLIGLLGTAARRLIASVRRAAMRIATRPMLAQKRTSRAAAAATALRRARPGASGRASGGRDAMPAEGGLAHP